MELKRKTPFRAFRNTPEKTCAGCLASWYKAARYNLWVWLERYAFLHKFHTAWALQHRHPAFWTPFCSQMSIGEELTWRHTNLSNTAELWRQCDVRKEMRGYLQSNNIPNNRWFLPQIGLYSQSSLHLITVYSVFHTKANILWTNRQELNVEIAAQWKNSVDFFHSLQLNWIPNSE